MQKVLSPDKAIAYCAIVLSELSLNPRNENSIVSSTYLNFDFAGISMPAIQIDGSLSFDQRAQIGKLCQENRNSSMFRFDKLLHHYRRKISRCLNSKRLDSVQRRWLNDPENVDRDVKFSPRFIAEDSLHKWSRKASHKSLPGLSGQFYSDYLDDVFSRLA
jgi:hypothetical protein